MISGVWPALQQTGLKKIMYKLFAIICILANGELQCTTYDDSDNQIFTRLQDCDSQASYRFYGMAEVFDAYNIPWERMEVGCKEEKDS